jgi:hypothetical protein
VVYHWAMGWMITGSQGLIIFLFIITSNLAMGPTQPPIQWAPGVLSLGIKQPRCEANNSTPSSAEVKNAWRYTATTPNTPSYRIQFKAQGQLYFYLLLTSKLPCSSCYKITSNNKTIFRILNSSKLLQCICAIYELTMCLTSQDTTESLRTSRQLFRKTLLHVDKFLLVYFLPYLGLRYLNSSLVPFSRRICKNNAK